MTTIPPNAGAISSRRAFLGKLACTAGIVASGTSLLPRAFAAQPAGAYTLWAIEAVETDESFGDGSTVHFYRFQPYQGSAKRGKLPYFEATEGETVVLGLKNSSRVPLQPSIPGVVVAPVVPAGQTGWVMFTMPPAGSYQLSQESYRVVSGPCGLAGTMVSRPSNGLNELWNGGPAFDREYTLHYQDSDSRWNVAAANLQMPNLSEYQPNYFTLNGYSYPDIAADPDSVVACNVGERVLLRMSNSGHMRQSIHFHGYHAQIVARNNVPVTAMAAKDTFEVAGGSTVDIILNVLQAGSYPLHPHSLTAVTANGLYPYGQLTLIVAS